ncbi:MAG TPA: cytochrome c peroxidase [Kofleriaceae bacterium]|nr:cytochrome c peroxidase [Kofleriaceae bacterium]
MWRSVMVAALSVAVGCGDAHGGGIPDLGPPAPTTSATSSRDVDFNPRLLRRFRRLPEPAPENADLIALGKMLFFDPRLSHDQDLSCNTCHPLDRGGTDHRSVSIGTDGQRGKRNAPTVFNAATQIAQFWDGRAPDLEHQAMGPILDSTEMAMLEPTAVEARLRTIPGYLLAFSRAFPTEITTIDLPHAGRAIAAFERTLVTPSRWDRFLDGDGKALTRTEQVGLKLFADLGCVDCHTGELVGASMFQKAGVRNSWPNQLDQGRYQITHLEADRMVFKVPSLRNVAATAPYFHDGSAATLRTAIAMMGRYQLDIELTPPEIAAISAWLTALDAAPHQIDPPTLP